MMQNVRKSVLDFSHDITERTQYFTAREWVFKAIDDWLIDTQGLRFFLLEGEPGSGKTAIAARLSQISQGTIAQQGLTALTRNVISAVHFCNARDTLSIDPFVFVNSVATQLANCYPDYLDLLNSQSEDRHIHINVQQNVQLVVSGQVAGVIINVNAQAPESAFNRAVREPLEILLRTKPDEQVIILVDALDEALAYSGISNIAVLLARIDGLSSHVRFILTTRPEEQVMGEFTNAKKLSLSIPHDQRCQEDISRYVQLRLRDDSLLAEKVAQVDHDQVARLTEVLPLKADGNFQFVRFMLDSIAKGLRRLLELEGLPTGLDWLYFDSLRRVVQFKRRDWFTDYRPLMGILAVAQESLTIVQLQAFTSQSEEAVWQYLGDLQQFIEEVKSQDEKGVLVTRYRLFHESFHDFLHAQSLVMNDEQIRNSFFLSKIEWHRALANWCERNGLEAIWENAKLNPAEQGRREYARRYYIAHLYIAREWQRLFAVLDEGMYGQAKVRDDPTMRVFVQDLDLGRQAAAWEGWTMEEGIRFLPQLWRYSLLRCSLIDRADRYPAAAFKLLVLLKHESQALDLAVLLTKPSYRAEIVAQIARCLAEQPRERRESTQLFKRACEVASTIEDSSARAWALNEIGAALIQVGQWEQAEVIIRRIEKNDEKAWGLRELGLALARARQRERAETVMLSIEKDYKRGLALNELAVAFSQAQQWEQAEAVWMKAEAIIRRIEKNDEKAWGLRELGLALTRAQKQERAEAVWTDAEAATRAVEEDSKRAWALSELGKTLVQAQQWKRAEAVIFTIEDSRERAWALSELGVALGQVGQWELAEAIIRTIEKHDEKAWGLKELGLALARAQQWKQAEVVWTDAEAATRAIENDDKREKALRALAVALAQAQEWERASSTIQTIKGVETIASAVKELSTALVHAQQWERAEIVIRMLDGRAAWAQDETVLKAWILIEMGKALVQAQQRERANVIWTEAEKMIRTIEWDEREVEVASGSVHRFAETDHWNMTKALSQLATALMQAQQWVRAKAIIRTIKESDSRARALSELGIALVHAHEWEQAKSAWKEAMAIFNAAEENDEQREERASVLIKLGEALAEVHQWERARAVYKEAQAVIQKIKWRETRERALHPLNLAMEYAQRWERAETIARTAEEGKEKTVALNELSQPFPKVWWYKTWRPGEKDEEEKASRWFEALPDAREDEQILHLVQHA